MSIPLNTQIAMKLQEMSDLLEQQGANPFRIKAYHSAAQTLAEMQRDIGDMLTNEGTRGLQSLPGIGRGIATAIAEMITTGRWAQLDRLKGSLDPVHRLQIVPGIGSEMATRIHDELHIDTLEALESAAYDGTLEKVKGIGARRLAALRASLTAMLNRTRRDWRPSADGGPEVALLLETDRAYRSKAAVGELPTIAPKRFNPEGAAWLPILHSEQAGWHFTVMFSNTARAHQLRKTDDWVVIYYYDDHHQEGQHTVVTETHGPLLGRRVVRGREAECRCYYQG